MVFKNVQRIKNALPEVLHVAMFYNNGTIFQTTFEQDINIPKLGENLAGLLNHFRKIYDVCNIKLDDYNKLIFETDDISISILKLGEDSNLALFFKKEQDQDLKLQSIRRYIHRIENLIDMDKIELKIQELGVKEEEFKNLQNILSSKLEQIKNYKTLYDTEILEQESKRILKEIESLEQDCAQLNLELELKKKDIDSLREKIEQERKIIQKDSD
ncbi:MAG: hypothetical protein ACFFHV_23695 [Promethearchaeota archaeon]